MLNYSATREYIKAYIKKRAGPHVCRYMKETYTKRGLPAGETLSEKRKLNTEERRGGGGVQGQRKETNLGGEFKAAKKRKKAGLTKSKNGQIRWMRLFLEMHREEVKEEESFLKGDLNGEAREEERNGTRKRRERKERKRKMADRRGAVASLFLFLSNKLLSICRPDPPPRAQKATQTRACAHTPDFPLYTQTQYYKRSPHKTHTFCQSEIHTLPTLF